MTRFIQSSINNQTNGFEEKTQSTLPSKKDGVVGPIIGSVIIIILLVLGALYFYGTVAEKRQAQNQRRQTAPLSESTKVADIESDLNTSEIDTVDADMAELEAEIDAAI